MTNEEFVLALEELSKSKYIKLFKEFSPTSYGFKVVINENNDTQDVILQLDDNDEEIIVQIYSEVGPFPSDITLIKNMLQKQCLSGFHTKLGCLKKDELCVLFRCTLDLLTDKILWSAISETAQGGEFFKKEYLNGG